MSSTEGGWTNPFESFARQNGNHLPPNFRGENKKDPIGSMHGDIPSFG